MKLVLAQPYLTLKGGAERVILKIAQHYDAKIYTTEYNKETTFPEFADVDIELIKKKVPLSGMLPYRASQGLRYGYTFYNTKIKDDYDLINSHISPSEWIRHKNSSVLWYCHTPPREVYDLYSVRMKNRSYTEKFIYATLTNSYKFIANKVVKELEGIATNSNNTASRIRKYFGREATVINPAVDYKKFKDEGDSKYFLYPSRIISNKRQDYAIEAFKKFEKKVKGYKLIIAGVVSKDKEHIEYFEKIKRIADDNVEFKIGISEQAMLNLYSKSTAVLFAGINEDFGYVPLEAMASYKPIISINEGGPKETIVDGETGYLVNSTDEMASKMQFIAEHPLIAAEMGKKGRKRVEEKYNWEVFFKKFDKLALSVIKEKREEKE
ncbi:MAG: glycosyltransferase [Candidatus Micrarchaeia archaeon]